MREAFDFVLLDVWLPDGSGLDLLAEIVRDAPETVVVLMSGHGTIDVAVQATKLGAFDFLEKPISLERLLVLLRNAGAALSLQAENRRLRQGVDHVDRRALAGDPEADRRDRARGPERRHAC